MNVQVLAATMNKPSVDTVVTAMNINSDAIIINQSNSNSYDELILENGSVVKFYTFNERGVGLSRNSALMRSTSKYAVFADEDEIFEDGYAQTIEAAFDRMPDADMIVFNVESLNKNRPMHNISTSSRVRLHNSLRYGAVRFAIRVESIHAKNISFSLLFGGGAKYSSGEDSLFISNCIKSGLRVYTCPDKIGVVAQDSSTWFEGYTDKFFTDKGALFKALSPRLYVALIIQFALRKKHEVAKDRSLYEVIKLMYMGAMEYSR